MFSVNDSMTPQRCQIFSAAAIASPQLTRLTYALTYTPAVSLVYNSSSDQHYIQQTDN